MESFGFGKRRNPPNWPPFKQNYQSLNSQENLQLTPLPSTPGTRSSVPSAHVFSPDPNTAYTPDYLSHTPRALLDSPGKGASPPKKRRFNRGWQSGSRIALGCAVVVLVTNVCLTIGIVTAGHDMLDGVYMVYEGGCRETEVKDTWVHLGLNVVATVLLASSNYCMQLLSSPNRSEVDKAHAKRKWLDIGIPSIRNLRFLRRKKIALWWMLGLSSIPLHLVYNSVFYSALATNNYSVLYVSDAFINGADYDQERFPDTSGRNITDFRARINTFERLDNQQCIHNYAKDFIEDRRNVIVVVRDPPADEEGSLFKVVENDFPKEITAEYNAFAWICDSPTVLNQTGACCENEWGFVPCEKIAPIIAEDFPEQWSTGGFEVSECYSEPVDSKCHLHFSLILMGVVLGFNILKVIGIGYVAFRLGEAPLVTAGDALQSFLRHPDRTTEGMSLASHASVIASGKLGNLSIPMRYAPTKHRFYEAASWRQWTFLLFLFAVSGAGTGLCMGFGIANFTGDKTIENAWSIGLGSVRPVNLVMSWNLPGYGNSTIVVSTLIANTPQVLFSFLYVCYNSLFTVMFLSRELMNFGVMSGRGKKYLRVSDARGEQKCTYFLNLPYKYGVPLLVGSGVMHWLVSQSVFLANITIIPTDGLVPMQDEITTIAYSPLAMLFLLSLTVVMLLFLGFIAMRGLPIGMPLMCSNSMAISAACHPPVGLGGDVSEREDMVLKPLSWGAVPGKTVGDLGLSYEADNHAHGFEGPDDGRGIGHCCFSDKTLEPPQIGKLYA